MKLSQFEVKPQRRNSLFVGGEDGDEEIGRPRERGQKTRVSCLGLGLGSKVEFVQPQKCDKCNNSCKARNTRAREKPQ